MRPPVVPTSTALEHDHVPSPPPILVPASQSIPEPTPHDVAFVPEQVRDRLAVLLGPLVEQRAKDDEMGRPCVLVP
jgi:hypothetical protein